MTFDGKLPFWAAVKLIFYNKLKKFLARPPSLTRSVWGTRTGGGGLVGYKTPTSAVAYGCTGIKPTQGIGEIGMRRPEPLRSPLLAFIFMYYCYKKMFSCKTN